MNIDLLLFCLLLSFFLHFVIQKTFIYFKKFDDFNYRSSHKTLATRTGGIGIFITLLIISLNFYFQNKEIFDYSLFIPISIMFIVGVYDDFYNANFKLKFLLQIIVAKILIDQGYVISNFHGFLGFNEVPRILAQITTVFVFLLIVNSINFIDGIDGLAITEVIKTILLVEFFSEIETPFKSLSLILLAGILPLYYFNFKKKNKVFLGDGGSLLLGTILAIYIFYLLGDNYQIISSLKINKVIFSVLVILYPLIDLLRVFIVRIKNKKSPFHADQNHIHHILFKKGYNSFTNFLIIQFVGLLVFCLLMYNLI